jgi:hypothetical protein
VPQSPVMAVRLVGARIVRKEHLFARDRQTRRAVPIFFVKRTIVLMYTWPYLLTKGPERPCFEICCLSAFASKYVSSLSVRFVFKITPDDHHSEFSDPYNFRGVDKSAKWQETVATHIYVGLHVRALRGIPSADAEITVPLVWANVARGVPVAPTM